MRFSRLHISFAFVNAAIVVTSAVAILHRAQLVSVRILASLQTYHCAIIFRIATLPRRFPVVPTAPRMNMSSRVTSMYKIHTLSIKHMFQIADTPLQLRPAARPPSDNPHRSLIKSSIAETRDMVVGRRPSHGRYHQRWLSQSTFPGIELRETHTMCCAVPCRAVPARLLSDVHSNVITVRQTTAVATIKVPWKLCPPKSPASAHVPTCVAEPQSPCFLPAVP